MDCYNNLIALANAETNIDRRYTLFAAASLLLNAIENFSATPSLAGLQHLNGAWAYAWRVQQIATPTGGGGAAGSMPVPERNSQAA